MKAAELLSIDITVEQGQAPHVTVFGSGNVFVLRLGLSHPGYIFPCIQFCFKSFDDLLLFQEHMTTAIKEFSQEKEEEENDPGQDTI